MMKAGSKVGRLIIVSDLGTKPNKLINKGRWYLCRCMCGSTKEVRRDRLLSGNTKSCGCLMRELSKKRAAKLGVRRVKHGHYRSNKPSPTYYSWTCMKQRCYYKGAHNYKHYGAKGIKVCKEWLNNFNQFLKDMGKRPKGKTLDRINVYGNYEPKNCRWATMKQQNNNTRKKMTN